VNPGKHHPHPINGAIQAATVLVLDEGRRAIGQFPLKEALAKARAQGQDLILIASGANPPVCLMADYGRFLFEHNKRVGHRKRVREKEIQLSANIFEHDLEVKARHAREFLEGGHPVRVVLKLRGREKAHPEIGRRKLDLFLAKLDETTGAKPRRNQVNGSVFVALLHPKP
jgi:translation initiation factor IF-3